MRLPSALVRRHALRVLLMLAGAGAFLAAPPAFSAGLPGPGLWPRCAGACLLFCALFLPATPSARKASAAGAFVEAGGLLLSGLLWMLLLFPAGWLPATALAALLACRSGGCTFRESVGLAALLCLFLWLGMEVLLDWPLPHGFLFSSSDGA